MIKTIIFIFILDAVCSSRFKYITSYGDLSLIYNGATQHASSVISLSEYNGMNYQKWIIYTRGILNGRITPKVHNGKCLSIGEDGELIFEFFDLNNPHHFWTIDSSYMPEGSEQKRIKSSTGLCLTAYPDSKTVELSRCGKIYTSSTVFLYPNNQRWTTHGSDTCTRVNWESDLGNSFAAIDISATTDNTVLALDSSGNAYSYTAPLTWTKLPEPSASSDFKLISAGSSDEIWGTNQVGGSYRYDSQNNQWISEPQIIGFEQISIAKDNTIIFGRHNSNKLYYRLPGEIEDQNWIPFDHSRTWMDVSVGSDDKIWTINAGSNGGRAYQWFDTSTTYVGCSPTACFERLSVGSDGTVFGIDEENKIYYYYENGWKLICGHGISKISVVTQDNIWGIIGGRIATAKLP